MAKSSVGREALKRRILNLFSDAPDGLEFGEIVERLHLPNDVASERDIRNLLKDMVDARSLERRRKITDKRGATPYTYHLPAQLSLFDLLGITGNISNKEDVDVDDRSREDTKRFEFSRSILEELATNHVEADHRAKAIIGIAADLAEKNPLDLLLEMARWMVEDINQMGKDMIEAMGAGRIGEATELADELDSRLDGARTYWQTIWRLDPETGDYPAIVNLPGKAKHFRSGQSATLNEELARTRLSTRIFGKRFIETAYKPNAVPHKSAVGTDASVADIDLEHPQGSFIPPDIVSLLIAAASQIAQTTDGPLEYQDFDINPDRLADYTDRQAAEKGLLISPLYRSQLPEDDYKHTRMAAMELRQYDQDLRVARREADWRPIGHRPSLGISFKPTLIFRDGRLFPLVHRLKDYEMGNLYGIIVRKQVENFAQVIHQTSSGPLSDITYSAVVKDPRQTLISPLVFWYIYRYHDANLVTPRDIYRSPFSDTAVSHLLFLGLAKQSEELPSDKMFVTFRILRRYSDLAIGDDLPVTFTDESGATQLVNENRQDDWRQYIEARIREKQKKTRSNLLEMEDYSAFIYLCARSGVSMCFVAPMSAYADIVRNQNGAHFLLPRLEVSVDMSQMENPDHENRRLDSMLSWLSAGGWVLDGQHTQSGFESENATGIPILVPDVIVPAHEAVTFARDSMSQEVYDALRELIMQLRKRSAK